MSAFYYIGSGSSIQKLEVFSAPGMLILEIVFLKNVNLVYRHVKWELYTKNSCQIHEENLLLVITQSSQINSTMHE